MFTGAQRTLLLVDSSEYTAVAQRGPAGSVTEVKGQIRSWSHDRSVARSRPRGPVSHSKVPSTC